jgi:CelD/BcsL family acetyltransferase involved in cellulose biosynthesis
MTSQSNGHSISVGDERRAASERDATANGPRIVIAEGLRAIDAIEARATEIEALAARSIEPNPFFEPWMLAPLLRAFGAGKSLEIAMIERPGGALIGFFPLVKERRYRGLPVKVLSIWDHDLTLLGTPLVHGAHARDCVAAFLDWAFAEADAALLSFERMPGGGPFARVLLDALNERREPFHSESRHFRGLFVPRADDGAYLASILDSEGRRKLKTKERRLSEGGAVTYDALEPSGDLDRWLAEFLALEASGWKGEARSAMGSTSHGRRYFEDVLRAAFARGRLEMLALRVGDRPVAMRSSLVSGDAAFVFKIAYDEALARHSPGMLLEIETIRRLHAKRALRWIDSCSSPTSRLFGDVCNDRRMIEAIVVPTGRERGRLLLALLPLARWGTRIAKRLAAPILSRIDRRAR